MEDWGEAPVAMSQGEREADPDVGAEVDQMDEPDTEHENLPVEEEP
jgi:hypothetical protein